jgi:hypothetical protein
MHQDQDQEHDGVTYAHEVMDHAEMTNQDVDPVDWAAEERDAMLRLDAADDEARAAREEQDQEAEVASDDLEDCGASNPQDMCGACEGCREATSQDIETSFECGVITYEEALHEHSLNGTSE